MANTLGNYDPIQYASETLLWLQKALGMASRVHVGYDQFRRVASIGQTISITRPTTFVAATGSLTATAQDLDPDTVDIKLDKPAIVPFKVSDVELAYTGEQIITDHIAPAAYALADQIDMDLAALYKDIPWLYDYGASTDHTVITGTRRVARDNKVPLSIGSPLHFMVDGVLEEGFLNSQVFHSADTTGPNQNQAMMTGDIGVPRFGIRAFANQNTPLHTPGTIVAGADQAGAVDMAAGLTKGATSVVVDSFTGSETLLAGDTFSIAGNTQKYAVTADVTMSTGAGTINFTPPAVQAYADDAVVTVAVQTATAHAQQLFFHRNAFALAFAQLPRDLPGVDVGVATDPVTGMSVRMRRWAEGKEAETWIAVDTLYGVKTLDPNLAVRAWT